MNPRETELSPKETGLSPKETVLEAVAHHGTPVIPYIISIHPEIQEKLDVYYGGRDNYPGFTDYVAATGVKWRGCDPQPGQRFHDIFGVEWQQGNIFHIVEPRLKEPSLEGYTFPSLVKDEELPGLRQWCEEHSEEFKIFTFGLVFWERTWSLRGMENMMMDLVTEQSFVDELFDRLMEKILEGLEKVLPLPFDSIRFGDDFGSQRGVLMGLPHWRKFIKPRLARMYGKVRDAGKMVSIHSCGDNSEILGEMIDLGLQIFNPAQPEANDLADMKKRYGNSITFEGGIGTQRNLPFGTPEQIKEEIRRCRLDLGSNGGFIMTTTKPLRPEVPVENAAAAIETIIEEAEKGSPLPVSGSSGNITDK